MGLKVLLNTQKAKEDGLCAIRVYINQNGKHAYSAVKNVNQPIYCDPKYFKDGKVKLIHPNHRILNDCIRTTFNRFEQIMLENPLVNAKDIVSIYKTGKPGRARRLIPFIETFIDDCGSGKLQRTPGTVQVYHATLNRLKDFNEEFNKDVDFGDIDRDFYNSFTSWLRKNGVKKENSIGKHIKTLKTFLNEAVERNVSNISEHKKKYFQVPSNETDAIYLNEAEMDSIINVSLDKYPHLQQERDRFIVSYYSLFRFSDSIRIDRSMLFKQGKKLLLRLRSKKTNIETILPVKPIVKEILERYNYQMEENTNQESNWKLKEIGGIASNKCKSLKEKVRMNGETDFKYNFIHTHTGRRSGATNLYLSGVDIRTISKLLGHRKITTTERYIRVDMLETANSMADHPFFK